MCSILKQWDIPFGGLKSPVKCLSVCHCFFKNSYICCICRDSYRRFPWTVLRYICIPHQTILNQHLLLLPCCHLSWGLFSLTVNQMPASQTSQMIWQLHSFQTRLPFLVWGLPKEVTWLHFMHCWIFHSVLVDHFLTGHYCSSNRILLFF